MNKLIVCWVIMGALFAVSANAEPTPSQEYASQVDVIQKMAKTYKTSVTVRFVVCDELNGAYYPETNTIELCTESSELPGAGRFIAAHEMAHAILWHYNGDLDEYHADELAVLALLHDQDDVEDVQAGALWFIETLNPKHRGDSHPSEAYRAVWMIKMVDGYLKTAPQAEDLYEGTLARYQLMLELDNVEDED